MACLLVSGAEEGHDGIFDLRLLCWCDRGVIGLQHQQETDDSDA